MKRYLKEHKNEFIVGVVVSISTALIIKLFSWIVSAGPQIGTSVFSLLINRVYYSASKASALSIMVDGITIFGGSLLGIFTFVVFKSAKIIREESVELKINEKYEVLQKNGKFTEEQSEETVKLINKYNKIKSKDENDKKKDVRSLRLRTIVVVVSAIILVLLVFFYTIVPIYMKNTFDTSVAQIAPFIDEHEVLVIKSRWASMKTSEDYKEILDYIDNVKAQNNID